MKKQFTFIIGIITLIGFLAAIYFLSSRTLTKIDTNQSDGLYRKMVKEYRLNADGSINYHYYHKLKIFTYNAFHRFYGETFIVYNPNFQKLNINKSETTMANGKIVVSPQNAYNEVLPGYAANSYSYNHLREMVVTHTGLEKNCEVELDYEIQSTKEFFPALLINEMLTTSSPIEELEIIISVPEDIVFNYQIMNLNSEPKLNRKDGMKQYTWKIRNLKAVSREVLHTYNSEPRLMGKSGETSINSWFEAILANDRLNDSIIRKVKEICSKQKEKKDQISDIQKFVSSQINTVAIPLSMTGYRARTSAQVWNSNSGTELEKTILLYQMLKKADFSPVPVGIAMADVKPELLCSAMVQEIGLNLNLESVNYYFTAIKPGLQLVSNVAFNTALFPFTNVDKQGQLLNLENAIQAKLSFVMDKDLIIKGEANLKLKGKANPYVDFMNSADKAKSLLININEGSVVVKISEYTPDSSQLTLELDNYNGKLIPGGYAKIILPEVSSGFSSWNIKYLDFERGSDLLLPSNLKETYSFSIDLPKNWVLANDSLNYTLSNSFGDIVMKIYAQGNKVKVERKIKINEALIHPDEYKMVRQLINEWLNPAHRNIILKRK